MPLLPFYLILSTLCQFDPAISIRDSTRIKAPTRPLAGHIPRKIELNIFATYLHNRSQFDPDDELFLPEQIATDVPVVQVSIVLEN